MKLKIAFLLIAQVTIGKTSLAQNSVKTILKELQIGDYVSQEMVMGKLVNYKKETAKFSDFKGKLLILDFWATTCGTCIAQLPKMEKLQGKFKDKIIILPVNYEKEEKVKSFLEKINLNISSIVEDTLLQKLFSHLSIPHEIWIDENGKILAQTGFEEVNEKNIATYLNSKLLKVREKKDIFFDYNLPLFVKNNGGIGEDFFYRSIMTNEISGLVPVVSLLRKTPLATNNMNGIAMVNVKPLIMYTHTLFMGRKACTITPCRTVIETQNSTFQPMNYFRTGTIGVDNFNDTALYCYNLTLPDPGTKDSVFFRNYLLNDLNRNFNLNGRIEKRKVDSWIITRIAESKDILFTCKTNEDEDRIIFDSPNLNILERIQNVTFDECIKWLQDSFYAAPLLINESGYSKEKIQMNFNIPYYKNKVVYTPLELITWRKIFNKYGLDIKEGKREVEVLVLTIPDKETPAK